jgi:hypothetical protein
MTATNAAGETITWEAPDADVWELEAAHGNRMLPIALRDEFEEAFSDGFRRTFATLGVPLSHIELRHVNGWPYISFFLHDVPRKAGAPPPAFVLKVLTRVHPGFRRRTRIARQAIAERRPQRLAEDWFAERQAWIGRILRLQRRDLDELDDAAMAEYLREVAAVTVDGARRHFELVSGCIPLGEWLHHSARWGLDPAQARAAVMHGVPIHAEARQRLQRIADELGESVPTDLDEIRAHGAGAAAALDDYIAHDGWWARDGTPTVVR